MTQTDWRKLCAELTDELSGYASANPHHDSDALVTRARAALAQPVAEGMVLTDDQLDLLVIAIQALAPHQPDASSHHLAAVDQGREILRNALARWGSGQVILDNSAPAPAVEVTDLRRTADLLEQRHPAPVPGGMIPVEYWDIDSGARIVTEPSEEGPGGCWVVLNSRYVNPFTEFPTAKAAWDALQQATTLHADHDNH